MYFPGVGSYYTYRSIASFSLSVSLNIPLDYCDWFRVLSCMDSQGLLPNPLSEFFPGGDMNSGSPI